MPPRQFSRYTFSEALRDDESRLFLTDPKRFNFRERADNKTHTVKRGDTLGSLASRYFKGLPCSAGLWWLLGWYQPDPIHDPTIDLEPGRTLVVPSLDCVHEAFDEARRTEDE